jgi:hypothetical protein
MKTDISKYKIMEFVKAIRTYEYESYPKTDSYYGVRGMD